MDNAELHHGRDAAASGLATDPVCGMQVEIASARWTAERDGETFYFCAPGCRKALQSIWIPVFTYHLHADGCGFLHIAYHL